MTEPASHGEISLDTVVVAAKEQVSSDLADEKVILSVGTGHYYGLRGVGGRIWDLLSEPRQVSDIRDILVSDYDVEAERCQQDLLELLAQLIDRGLVEIRGAASP